MLRVGRDGGLQNFELHGLVTLHIADEKSGRIRVQLENKDTRGIQLQVSNFESASVYIFHLYLGPRSSELACAFKLQEQEIVDQMIRYMLHFGIGFIFHGKISLYLFWMI